MDPRIEKVLGLIHSELRQPLTLRRLADAVNLSPTRLCYLFRVETGVPPGQYLKSVRMRTATKLLGTTFLRIKEIADQSGFSDESHFVRDFKKIYGATPSQYRKQTLLPVHSDLGNTYISANEQ